MANNQKENPLVLSDVKSHEDAYILAPPPAGMALVQTVDVLSPLGNNPRLFGQCAAANALSDIYAMGAEAYSAMNILSFAACDFPLEVIEEILLGSAEKLAEAGAVNAGGHTLEDPQLKFGLAVTGLVDPNHFAANKALQENDVLILTKAIGTGVLATGIKAKWDNWEQAENALYSGACHLNKYASSLIQDMKLLAATDVTGFGLGGHALEMAQASNKHIYFSHKELPLLDFVLDYAKDGLIPAGTHANLAYAQKHLCLKDSALDAEKLLTTLFFDAQTSGGLLLAVPRQKCSEALTRLKDLGESAFVVGEVKGLSKEQKEKAHFITIE